MWRDLSIQGREWLGDYVSQGLAMGDFIPIAKTYPKDCGQILENLKQEKYRDKESGKELWKIFLYER